MSYLDDVEYPANAEFDADRLMELTPEDICKWMSFTTYGDPNPGPDARPLYARSNTLKYAKKAISFFMPEKNLKWSIRRQEGNPTKSQQVNDLIATVVQQECRQQGVPSQACRDLTEGEFRQLHNLFRNSNNNNINRYGIPALLNFNNHLITRIDDSCQWKQCLFRHHPTYPDFAAQCRLAWSKNVRTEADAPWQIILGCNDPMFCVVLSLAVWLEFYLGTFQSASPYMFDFSGDYNVPKGGDKSKQLARDRLKDMFNGVDFTPECSGKLGSHSIRKFAATLAMGASGVEKHEVENRGRWRKNRSMLDVYTNVQLPYPDANVAEKLCIGGACSYRIKATSLVTDDWILQHVVPRIASSQQLGRAIGKLLGKALLWTIFSAHSAWVPADIVQRVRTAYRELIGNDHEELLDENPIEKRTLCITGNNATLLINELGVAGEDGQIEGAPGGHLESNSSRQMIHTLLSQMAILQAKFTQLVEAVEAQRMSNVEQFRTVHVTMRRIGNQPLRMLHRAAGHHAADHAAAAAPVAVGAAFANPVHHDPPAELSPTPRSLQALWDEWNVGIGGRKPARLFTREERGRVKFKFCRRKVVWELICLHIRANRTAQDAIEKLYEVYGQTTSVTDIINRLKADIRGGRLHPDLRV